MSYDASKVAFIDTETCGLDPERHPIWDIAVIVDSVEHEWQQRIPFVVGLPTDDFTSRYPAVDQWVLDNTRITQDYNALTALDPHESIARFCQLTRGRHLVGACPWFDSDRLHRLHLRTLAPGGDRSLPWHYHLIDVETLLIGYEMGQRWATYFDRGISSDERPEPPSLPWDSRELSRFVGIDPDDFQPAHTAITDARWAKACFEAVMGEPR